MKKLSLLLFTTALASCAVGPNYETPKLGFADDWNVAKNTDVNKTQTPNKDKLKVSLDGTPSDSIDKTDSQTKDKKVETKYSGDKKQTEVKPKPKAEELFTKSEWWENFNDPVLNQLITTAEKENFELKTAKSRVDEARGNRLSATAILLPQINGDVNTSRAKSRQPFIGTTIANTTQAGFDASWEVDIFGGQRRNREASEYQVEGAKADVKNVMISLRAEVARNYMEVRNYQNQIKITEDNIKSQAQSVNLTQAQRDAGTVSDLDVSQAQSLYFSTKSRLPALQTALEQAKNNLSVLLGQQPGRLDETLSKVTPVPVASLKFIIQTPATIISNRPDVKSAERNLAAATALKGAAIADYFPKISLTSFFGYYKNSLVKAGNIWSLGGSAVMPLLDFGNVRGEVNAADARKEQALNKFRQSVLEALADVQTSLVTYVNEEERRASLANAVATNKKAVELSRARYNTGIAAFTDVLIAEREMYDVQSQLAQSEANVAEDLIALNKALGR